jgi:hypothetical protein
VEGTHIVHVYETCTLFLHTQDLEDHPVLAYFLFARRYIFIEDWEE